MKIKDYYDILINSELFSGMDNTSLDELFSSKDYKFKQYTKDNIIALDGETCNSLDIILSGTVKIQRIDIAGNVLTITEINQSDCLGGNILFSSNPIYPMTIIAKTDVVILRLSKRIILDMCLNNELQLLRFLQLISDKTQILTNKIKNVVHKTLKDAIIDYLRYQYYIQESCDIELKTTKKDLAELFGVQRTSLSRELNKMKKEGLIDYTNKHIIIKDTSILR